MGVEDGGDTHVPRDITISHVAADITSLADFQAFVGQQLDDNLKPSIPLIGTNHEDGAAWGRDVPSPTIFDGRIYYHEAQQASLTNLMQYVHASEILIETIHRIMAIYRNSEESATLDLQRVAAIFGEVARRRAPVDTETARENRRAESGAATA